MQLAALKNAFSMGSLTGAKISPYMGKFILVITTVENKQVSMERKTGGVRQFSSYKAAINAAAEVGFDAVTISGISSCKSQ